VSDPKRFFPDPDWTFEVISDQGQIKLFMKTNKKIFKKNFELLIIGTAVLFSPFYVIKKIFTRWQFILISI